MDEYAQRHPMIMMPGYARGRSSNERGRASSGTALK
jgi:hypothetical protein